MKTHKHTYFLWACLVCWGFAMAFAACSDLDNYNTVPADRHPSANQTLWQNIQSNANLSQFAQLIEKSGFAEELQSSKVYTVWAPLDGTYEVSESDDQLLTRFVKNHIACYDHQLKTGETDRIYTLNGKSFDFTEASYGEQPVASLNQPCSNGVLHTIEGRQQFYPNLYEYLTTTTGIDSIQTYFRRFETTTLDENASILGPVVGGRQTYIDSVMVTDNSLFRRLNAYVNNEIYSYTALFPTDAAWTKTYERIRPYFRYAAKTVSQDLSVEGIVTQKTRNINAASFGDSLARYAIVKNLFYDNNNEQNAILANRDLASDSDTIYSTIGTPLTNVPEIFVPAVSEEHMSNGTALVVDSLAFTSSIWTPDLYIYGVNSSTRPRVLSALPTNVYLSEDNLNTDKSTVPYSYVDLVPSGARSLPDVYFYLPGVLSATYEIYAVILPADIRKGYTGEVKPNKFSATLTYCNASGVLETVTLGDSFINDTSKVDWMLLGEVTFPISYYALGSDQHPTLELKSNLRIFNATEMATYDRELRIAAIVLRAKVE